MKDSTSMPSISQANAADDAREVLRSRARALAHQPQLDSAAETRLEVLEFRLARETYAVETCHVCEVLPLTELTPLPCTPSFVPGVVNVRGRIVPVIDIKKFFDLPDSGLTDLHCVIRVLGNDLEIGMLADVIVGLRTIALDSLQPSLPTLTGIRADYLKGVTADRLVVLDLMRMLTDPRIIVHEEVQT